MINAYTPILYMR